MQKKTFAVVLVALSAVLNIVGANLALFLKLPVYLDTLGTMVTAAILGPWYAICTGVVSGVINGITTDVYAFFFLPVQCIVAVLAGWIFWRQKKGRNFPLLVSVLLISVPGTVLSAVISAGIFGGVTSSGSTVLVQLFYHLGFRLTTSVFVVQVVTDFVDKLFVFLAAMLLARVVKRNFPNLETEKRKGNRHVSI